MKTGRNTRGEQLLKFIFKYSLTQMECSEAALQWLNQLDRQYGPPATIMGWEILDELKKGLYR